MKGIRATFLPLSVDLTKNKVLAKKSKLYQQTCDTFTRSKTAQDIARDFYKDIVKPYSDWTTKLPADKEAGSELLKDLITPYTKAVKSFCKKDADDFVHLALGQKQIELIEESSKNNSAILDFKNSIENATGKNLSELVKKQ